MTEREIKHPLGHPYHRHPCPDCVQKTLHLGLDKSTGLIQFRFSCSSCGWTKAFEGGWGDWCKEQRAAKLERERTQEDRAPDSEGLCLEFDDLIVIYREALTVEEIDALQNHPEINHCMHMNYYPDEVPMPRLHKALQDKFGVDFEDKYDVCFDDDF